MNEHQRLLHAGPQQVLFSLRDRYWPMSGRSSARAVVRECITCFRQKAQTVNPAMGNLPAARLKADFPFSTSGVDYAGPFLIKDKKGRGHKSSKVWMCLFVCFATRAVHLELPAYSPHFGGLWEAGVKSVKHHLKRILQNALLTFEEF